MWRLRAPERGKTHLPVISRRKDFQSRSSFKRWPHDILLPLFLLIRSSEVSSSDCSNQSTAETHSISVELLSRQPTTSFGNYSTYLSEAHPASQLLMCGIFNLLPQDSKGKPTNGPVSSPIGVEAEHRFSPGRSLRGFQRVSTFRLDSHIGSTWF